MKNYITAENKGQSNISELLCIQFIPQNTLKFAKLVSTNMKQSIHAPKSIKQKEQDGRQTDTSNRTTDDELDYKRKKKGRMTDTTKRRRKGRQIQRRAVKDNRYHEKKKERGRQVCRK